MNFSTQTIAQGALLLTITAGGVFYTTSSSVEPAGNGCIQYIDVDGTTNKLCGESASLLLKQADDQALAQQENKTVKGEPTSTAALPKQSKSDCQRKKEAGHAIGPFCKISLALEAQP